MLGWTGKTRNMGVFIIMCLFVTPSFYAMMGIKANSIVQTFERLANVELIQKRETHLAHRCSLQAASWNPSRRSGKVDCSSTTRLCKQTLALFDTSLHPS